MRIADQIAHVSREFIAGSVLLDAVAAQEGITQIQAASWFLRHIEQLNALPMLSFNAERQDFQQFNQPWSGDIFRDITSRDPEGLDWDSEADGYVGGWLSSHLQKFFKDTGIPFPEFRRNGHAKSAVVTTPQAVASVQSFLAAHKSDFLPLRDWLESIDSHTQRTARALRLAIESVGGFPPIFVQEASSIADVPTPLTIDESSGVWADILVELMSEMIPDVIAINGQEIWSYSLYVRDSDCATFLTRAGLPAGAFAGLDGGLIARGTLDFEAALARAEASVLKLPGTPAPNQDTSASADKSLSARERDSLLRIIGALLSLIAGDVPEAAKHPSVSSEAELIRLLDRHFDGYEGLSESNLSRKFPAAKRLLSR